MAPSITLRDGSTVHHVPDFLGPEEANALFAHLLVASPWNQERTRFGPMPRLTVWYADAGLRYHYSGVTHFGLPWTNALHAIKDRVESASEHLFNSLLLSRYRNGRDSIGWHADDEPELGTNPAIASLSLGAVRTFKLKHTISGETVSYSLAHGSLLVMAGTCQHYWKHSVPKTARPVGERVNLTFRRLLR